MGDFLEPANRLAKSSMTFPDPRLAARSPTLYSACNENHDRYYMYKGRSVISAPFHLSPSLRPWCRFCSSSSPSQSMVRCDQVCSIADPWQSQKYINFLRTRMRTWMRTWSLVVLALWFFALCLKPVKAAGSGTLEVIMHKSGAVHGKQST